IGSGIRRGWNGVLTVLGVFLIAAVLAGMLLPALGKAKARAQRISAINNLKQIGLALKQSAADTGLSSDKTFRLPTSLDEMTEVLGTDKVLIDPESGQRFTYVAGGVSESDV